MIRSAQPQELLTGLVLVPEAESTDPQWAGSAQMMLARGLRGGTAGDLSMLADTETHRRRHPLVVTVIIITTDFRQ